MFCEFLKWQEHVFLCEHSNSSDENFMTLKYNARDEERQKLSKSLHVTKKQRTISKKTISVIIIIMFLCLIKSLQK